MALDPIGVLAGCNEKQEWLLPWWWSHVEKHNPDLPVAFADFGMSLHAQRWCRERGSLIEIPAAPLASQQTMDPHTVAHWEKTWADSGEIRDLWALRKTWYQKPMAMSLSPFQRTLWLDLDCEVRGSLTSLFSIPLSLAKMAASSVEINRCSTEIAFPHYNTGVALFEPSSPLIRLWRREIQAGSRSACTEEDLLSFLIAHFQIPIILLPHACNWEVLRFGANPNALIYHWMGERGKKAIQLLTAGA